MIMKSKLGLFSLIYIKLVLAEKAYGFADRNAPFDENTDPQCADTCTGEMQKLIEATPFFTSKNEVNGSGGIVDVARSSFFRSHEAGASEKKSVMSKFFTNICESYEKVDVCLTKCESHQISKSKDSFLNYHSNFWSKADSDGNVKSISHNNGVTMNLRQVYAGLQFICKERRSDFFDALPCLSEYEPSAMLKCSNEINRSQETTLLFTNSIVNREFHSIQLRFGTLCRDLNVMMKCMEPTIRRGCGDQPTNLMLSFIGLEFSSFEKLNEQLGFDQPLPPACRQLIQYSHERRLKQTSRKNTSGEKKYVVPRQDFNVKMSGSALNTARVTVPKIFFFHQLFLFIFFKYFLPLLT